MSRVVFPSQLDLKPQGRLLMEARYYMEISGESFHIQILSL